MGYLDSTTLAGNFFFKNHLSPDGFKLASAGDDHTLGLWDVATGQCLRICHTDDRVRSVAFSPDGLKLASAGDDYIPLPSL